MINKIPPTSTSLGPIGDFKQIPPAKANLPDRLLPPLRGRSLSAPSILVAGLLITSTSGFCYGAQAPANLSSFERNEDLIASHRVQSAIFPSRLVNFQAISSGHSGARVYGVTNDLGDKYFAKVVISWSDISNPSQMRAEFTSSLWAASQGLGPAIVFTDIEQGTLITQFLTNEMSDWDQGGQEPRLSATLATMRTLHESELPIERCFYQKDKAIASWKKEFDKVAPEERQHRLVKSAAEVAEACINRLSELTFDAVVRHGDLHQDNVIYHSGKAWLVDWATRNHGDAVQEVAYYAYHVDVPLSGLDSLLEKYAPLSAEDTKRARYHLALMHAQRYLQTLRGMSWDRPEWKESKLRMHEAYLIEDMEWLGLKDNI